MCWIQTSLYFCLEKWNWFSQTWCCVAQSLFTAVPENRGNFCRNPTLAIIWKALDSLLHSKPVSHRELYETLRIFIEQRYLSLQTQRRFPSDCETLFRIALICLGNVSEINKMKSNITRISCCCESFGSADPLCVCFTGESEYFCCWIDSFISCCWFMIDSVCDVFINDPLEAELGLWLFFQSESFDLIYLTFSHHRSYYRCRFF